MQIVIVDSSRVVLKIIASLLEARGHDVRSFTDSAAALAFIEDTPTVRILITSLEVQPITGLELCWWVRLLAEDRRLLYVIAMSSAHSSKSLVEALDSGADDFIAKPPSTEELHARLRVAERLLMLQEELIRLAETDPLTGLFNRRAFFAKADAAFEQADRSCPITAILVDIDHFKRVNDECGHDVGDRAIRAVADLLGTEGVVGRLGGEEFAVILPGWSGEDAVNYADRLRLRIRDAVIPAGDGALSMTCSFGVAARSMSEGVETLIKRADVALYDAKTGGRNRVVLHRAVVGFADRAELKNDAAA